MDWNKYFRYADGKLYHKPRLTKQFNSRFAGKLAGTQYTRYTYVALHGIKYCEHRVVYEMHNGAIPKDMVIHHINSNGLDNRLENLSLVTHKENSQKYDVLGKGYRVHTNGKFRATRIHNGVVLKLKQYGTKCGAIMASRTALL